MAKVNFKVKKKPVEMPDPSGFARVAPVPISLEARPQALYYCRIAGYLMDIGAYFPVACTGSLVVTLRAPNGVETEHRFPVERRAYLSLLDSLAVEKNTVIAVRVESDDTAATAVLSAYYVPLRAVKVEGYAEQSPETV
jgi:hypothetical protein